ncbi:hypothetical protein M8J77_007928 [Diaphorina citri]|nr:hypothetical protein M8J77_007928 [Diaphorina citri]
MEALADYLSSSDEEEETNVSPADKLKELDIKDQPKDDKTVKIYGPPKPERLMNQGANDVKNESTNTKPLMLETLESRNDEPPININTTGENKNNPEGPMSKPENIKNEIKDSSKESDESEESSGDSSSSSDEEDGDIIGPPIPTSLDTKDDLIGPPIPDISPPSGLENDSELVGPPIPSNLSNPNDNTKQSTRTQEDDEDDDMSEDEEEEEKLVVPLSKDITFRHGSKAVTGLAVDPAGARLASGAVDYEVKFWDFAGMDSSFHSFRSLYPCGNNPIKGIEYSSTGDAVLIVSGMSQAKIFDRDGIEILECVKGDQYIADLARTKGHTSPLTSGMWHPYLRQEFMTTSEDSSCRLWDVGKGSQHKSIMKCKTKNGLKTVPTTCSYSRDGNLIACGCMDGSIQMWDHRKMFVNTTKLLRDAHQNGSEISSLQFSYHGNMLCSRACDDTLKLWDLRNFKKPVHVAGNLFSRYGSTSCTFSPNDSMVMTGESINKGETDGKLHIFKTATFEKVQELSIPNSHIIKTIWHPRLNQIFIGCGDGSVKIFFDEDKSARGAKLFIGKKKTKKRQMDVISAASQPIITPHSLPLFRQEKPKPLHKKLEKERQDPVKSHRPDLPIKSGQGGRVAASGSTLSSYVIRNLGLSKRVEDDQDPREAILRYAKDAAENPYWITPAYKKTQPNAIFKKEEDSDEEGESKKPRLV